MSNKKYLITKQQLDLIAGAIKKKYQITENITYIDEFKNAMNDSTNEINALMDRTLFSSIQSIVNSEITKIGNFTFGKCTSLQSVSFPNCTTIGNCAFYDCASLQTVSFPNCTTIGNKAFYECTPALQSVYFPNCTTIGYRAFHHCFYLQTVSFPNCTTIKGAAFMNCLKLESVYLLGSSVATLVDVWAFYTTPISNSSFLGRFGSIYVPTSLVNAYKAATNWATYAARIVGV